MQQPQLKLQHSSCVLFISTSLSHSFLLPSHACSVCLAVWQLPVYCRQPEHISCFCLKHVLLHSITINIIIIVISSDCLSASSLSASLSAVASLSLPPLSLSHSVLHVFTRPVAATFADTAHNSKIEPRLYFPLGTFTRRMNLWNSAL